MTFRVNKWVPWFFVSSIAAKLCLASDPFDVELTRSGEGSNLVVTVRVAIPPNYHIYADQLHVETAAGVALIPAGGEAPIRLHDAFSEGERDAFTNDVTLRYRAGARMAPAEVLKVSYQGCSGDQCFLPKTLFFGTTQAIESGHANRHDVVSGMTVAGRASGYLNTKEFLSFLNRAEGRAELVARPENVSERIRAASLLFSANPLEFFKVHGVWWTVLIILVGGLLLNLTPCVLPMIPINLAIIGVGAQNGSKAKGFLLGGAYGLGIALVYGVLGVVVVLSGSQFGALNSKPWFNAAIGVVFVLLAMAMFDIFSIDMTRFQRAGSGNRSKQGKVVTAMFMGGISALLAGACVAPVVIAVLLLSSHLYAQGAAIGLLLPFLLGAGMALPWPFAGSGLSFLPKPGAWMTWVKTGFGAFIFLFAMYYFSLAYQGWSGKKAVTQDVPGVWRITGADDASWKAVKAESVRTGNPVFVDFWATWCKNCEAMELSTFRDSEVTKRLSGYVVVKYQAEDPTEKATRDVAEAFEIKGLPTYVVLKAEGGAP
ncbi:MAG: cytochrome c biogenesis protein CcdA [bacterium]